MLTEPINLSASISTLTCSPGVGGFLRSCSAEGSAGDTAHTSARAPGGSGAPWPHLPPPCARAPRQGSLQSTGMLQSILCLLRAGAVDLTQLWISTFHPEPWSPPHPCCKLLPRNTLQMRLSAPGACRWGAAGDCGQIGRSCGLAGENHCSVLIRRSKLVPLWSPVLFLPASHSVLPRGGQERQMALLSGRQGLNSTCIHRGVEQECGALGKSCCIGRFCLWNDLYCGVARAPLGARGFCGG